MLARFSRAGSDTSPTARTKWFWQFAGSACRWRTKWHLRSEVRWTGSWSARLDYLGIRSAPVPVHGRTVILVDDGRATGTTMRAAVLAIRRGRPAGAIVAVPVGARAACESRRAVADEVVCALLPEPFCGVRAWYID
jgi:hypothetical protein